MSAWHSKPSEVPHCLFCDGLNPWFSCDCETARAVQAGEYPKPVVRMRNGKTYIEMVPEILEIASKIGRFSSAP